MEHRTRNRSPACGERVRGGSFPASFAIALTTVATLLALPAVAAEKGRTLGYVISNFRHAAFDGDAATDCPDGFNIGQKEIFLSPRPAAERERLLRKENAAELNQYIYNAARINGSPRVNRCMQPTEYPDPGLKTLVGKTALGMDLDGGDTSATAAPGTCKHQNFAGPNGETGIDNQHWRALGCIRMYRREQDVHKTAVSAIRNGEMGLVMEITDVQDAKNDPDVTVGLYSTTDPLPTDGAGNPVTAGSLGVHDDQRFHNHLKGRIENGVLTTEPGDIRLQLRMGPVDTWLWFRAARLKIELEKDSAKGMLAGYADIEQLYSFNSQGTVDGGVVGGYTCAGIYGALHRLADGFADPETGICQAISTAWELTAVRGYVIHPDVAADASAGAVQVAKSK